MKKILCIICFIMNLHFIVNDTFSIICNNRCIAQYSQIELYWCEDAGVTDKECDKDDSGERIFETCNHCNEWVMCSDDGKECICPNTSACSYCGDFVHTDEEHECDAAPSDGNKTCLICGTVYKKGLQCPNINHPSHKKGPFFSFIETKKFHLYI